MKRKFVSALFLLSGFFLGMTPGASQAQDCRGNLVINEISNGPNGAKEWIELLPLPCGANSCDSIDISKWIIDDNNGIFTSDPAATGNNLGISSGHLRLKANDVFWTKFPRNRMLVLFNGQDFDSTNSDFSNAAAGVNGVYDNGTAFFVAVGTSNLVEVKFNTPINTGVLATSSIDYCNSAVYTFTASAWNAIGLRNDRLGDGIQTRCPGCNTAGEPAFYHGISFGDTTIHVAASVQLDGAHVALDSPDASNAAFAFYRNLNPGIDSNWTYLPANLATPGAYNSVDDSIYIANIRGLAEELDCCVLPPVDSTPKGVLIVTEFSNGPSGNCEYVELLVAGCNTDDEVDSVDIRGWVIDDNSGNFNTTRTCGSGVSITQGHLRLAYNNTWKKVAVGSVIVLFNGADNCYNFTDHNADTTIGGLAYRIYYRKVGTSTDVQATTTKPSTSNCAYCTGSYNVAATNWGSTVALGNTADAIQVRCPGCTDDLPAEPAFYHGVGYGSGFSGFAAGSSDLGGAYVSGSGSAKKYEFFQNTTPGANANWQSATANAAGSVPASAGTIRSSSDLYRDSVARGFYTYPCCGSGAGLSIPTSPFEASSNSITNIQEGSAFLYPNPANNSLNIAINSTSSFEVKMYDLFGKVVLVRSYPATQGTGNVQINTSELASGVYVYAISTSGANAQTISGKLMIQR